MFTFCKKIINSLLNTLIPPHQNHSFSAYHRPPINDGGAGLAILTTEIPKPSNVIVSYSVIKRAAESDAIDQAGEVIDHQAGDVSTDQASEVIDEGDDVIESSISCPEGGVIGVSCAVDGLSSCTESLGFESSNEMSNTNKFEIEELEKLNRSRAATTVVKSRRVDVKKQLPPPLTTLRADGKPRFFLRPVRQDGRLELIIEKNNRPPGLRAIRENGRLRLHFIEDQKVDGYTDYGADAKGKKKVEEEEEEDSSGEEDCESVKEMSSSNGHQHKMHGLGQRCVTIR